MSWYDLTVAGKSRVADRDAVIVTLTPLTSTATHSNSIWTAVPACRCAH